MIRKLSRVHLKTLNIHGGVTPLNENVIEDRAVAERMNRHPEFLEETMFAEHGTKVLITNPAADRYLDQHRDEQEKMKKIRDQYSQWTEEPEGDPSY